jgi:RNA polymerase sigma-70 factor (ECF subfamily)
LWEPAARFAHHTRVAREGKQVMQSRNSVANQLQHNEDPPAAPAPKPELRCFTGEEERIDRLVGEARAAHPRFAIDVEKFRRFLAARGEVHDRHVGDLYLAFACAERDRAALAEFERRYLALVPQWIARLREQDSFVDEVRQRLRERVLLGVEKRAPKILDYSGRGALGAWVRVTAMREALDLIDREKARRQSAWEGDGGLTPDEGELLGAAADPEMVALHQLHLPQFQEAFRGALESLDATERNLLRFHFVDGLNIGRVGELFGKSRATVGRMVIACRHKLLEETRRRLGAISGASPREVRSLIRLLRSHLDVSIRGFLRQRETGG